MKINIHVPRRPQYENKAFTIPSMRLNAWLWSDVLLLTLAVVAVVSIPNEAFAQLGGTGNDAWVKPGVTIVEALKSGVVTIGALIIGLGVMAVGVWACATLRMEWSKLGYVVIGGILVMAGPSMVSGLLSLAQQ